MFKSQFIVMPPPDVIAPLADVDNNNGMLDAVFCSLIKIIEPLRDVDIAEPD